jgi:hypothetical protein
MNYSGQRQVRDIPCMDRKYLPKSYIYGRDSFTLNSNPPKGEGDHSKGINIR